MQYSSGYCWHSSRVQRHVAVFSGPRLAGWLAFSRGFNTPTAGSEPEALGGRAAVAASRHRGAGGIATSNSSARSADENHGPPHWPPRRRATRANFLAFREAAVVPLLTTHTPVACGGGGRARGRAHPWELEPRPPRDLVSPCRRHRRDIPGSWGWGFVKTDRCLAPA